MLLYHYLILISLCITSLGKEENKLSHWAQVDTSPLLHDFNFHFSDPLVFSLGML